MSLSYTHCLSYGTVGLVCVTHRGSSSAVGGEICSPKFNFSSYGAFLDHVRCTLVSGWEAAGPQTPLRHSLPFSRKCPAGWKWGAGLQQPEAVCQLSLPVRVLSRHSHTFMLAWHSAVLGGRYSPTEQGEQPANIYLEVHLAGWDPKWFFFIKPMVSSESIS